MAHHRKLSITAAALALTALAACDAAPVRTGAASGASFQAQYNGARDALENARYSRAISSYKALVPVSGALANRMRVELAHSYLRANQYQNASVTAAEAARASSGEARSAALAVQGTADHERALAALSAGDAANGKKLLTRAQTALAAVLKDHPGLDPVGSLAGRKASIDVRLRSL